MTQKTPAPKPKGTVFKSAAAPAFTPDRVASAFIEEGKRRNISVIGIQEAICAGLDESGLRVLANPVNPASRHCPTMATASTTTAMGRCSRGDLRAGARWNAA
jgi:hypothetical protein